MAFVMSHRLTALDLVPGDVFVHDGSNLVIAALRPDMKLVNVMYIGLVSGQVGWKLFNQSTILLVERWKWT